MAAEPVFALTSLSPAAHARARQLACLESWRRAGLEIRCFNHPEDIAGLSEDYAVEFVPVRDTSSAVFGRHLVPVCALLGWAGRHDVQALLINADIELRLSPWELRRVLLLCAGGLCGFVRHNHGDDASRTSRESFGFDGFALHGRDAALFAPSFLSLGQPFWDYWLPHTFAAHGRALHTVDFPAALHRNHAHGWSWADWHRCALEFGRVTGAVPGAASMEACQAMSWRIRESLERAAAPVPERPPAIRAWVERRFGAPQPKVILELGAHCGEDTRWMAALPGAKVHAFEPDPRNRPPALPNVTVHRAAVAERDGRRCLLLSGTGWGREWTYSSSIRQPKNHLRRYPVTFGPSVEVDAVALDTFHARHGLDVVDFIWADIQGAEGEMIAGGGRTLARTRYLYTEYSDDELYDGQITLREMLRRLPGFRVLELWPEDVLLENRGLAA
jgi:FkbM family methyltransferase